MTSFSSCTGLLPFFAAEVCSGAEPVGHAAPCPTPDAEFRSQDAPDFFLDTLHKCTFSERDMCPRPDTRGWRESHSAEVVLETQVFVPTWICSVGCIGSCSCGEAVDCDSEASSESEGTNATSGSTVVSRMELVSSFTSTVVRMKPCETFFPTPNLMSLDCSGRFLDRDLLLLFDGRVKDLRRPGLHQRDRNNPNLKTVSLELRAITDVRAKDHRRYILQKGGGVLPGIESESFFQEPPCPACRFDFLFAIKLCDNDSRGYYLLRLLHIDPVGLGEKGESAGSVVQLEIIRVYLELNGFGSFIFLRGIWYQERW